MKSLKSRLRRQDAPGPAPSGSGAAASAVSPVARERPASRGVQFCPLLSLGRPRRLLLPQAGAPRRPGDPGDPPRRCPGASPGPRLGPAPPLTLRCPDPWKKPRRLLRPGCLRFTRLARPFRGDPHPSPLPGLAPRSPRGHRRAWLRGHPRGCGPGEALAPRSLGGRGSGPGATPPGLRTFCGSGTRRLVDVAVPLGKFSKEVDEIRGSCRQSSRWLVTLESVVKLGRGLSCGSLSVTCEAQAWCCSAAWSLPVCVLKSRWQENRNLEERFDYRCWDLDNLAS